MITNEWMSQHLETQIAILFTFMRHRFLQKYMNKFITILQCTHWMEDVHGYTNIDYRSAAVQYVQKTKFDLIIL